MKNLITKQYFLDHNFNFQAVLNSKKMFECVGSQENVIREECAAARPHPLLQSLVSTKIHTRTTNQTGKFHINRSNKLKLC